MNGRMRDEGARLAAPLDQPRRGEFAERLAHRRARAAIAGGEFLLGGHPVAGAPFARVDRGGDPVADSARRVQASSRPGRKEVVLGKSGQVGVDLGGRRTLKKKNKSK